MRISLNKYAFILFVVIVLDLNCFYLMDRYASITFFKYCDIVTLLKSGLFFFLLLTRPKKMFKKGPFDIILCLGVLMACLSAFSGTKCYGQSFVQGLMAQREWISSILLFFVMKTWLDADQISIKMILRMIMIISGIHMFIAYACLLTGNSEILNVDVNERYGSIRMRMEYAFIAMTLGFVIDRFFVGGRKKKRLNIRSLLFLLMGICFTIVITKERMRSAAIAGAILFCIFIRRLSPKKLFSIILVIMAAIIVINTEMGQDILDIVFGSGHGTSTDTRSIREEASLYYLQHIMQNPLYVLFGCGYPSASSSVASLISNPTIGYWTYYTTDVGILGQMFNYGVVGVIWFVLLSVLVWRKSVTVYRKTHRAAYMELLVYDLLGIVTLVPLAFNASIAYAFFLAMLGKEEKQLRD